MTDKQKIKKLREALDAAMERIASEYCSHPGPHSADNSVCYINEFYQVLKETE